MGIEFKGKNLKIAVMAILLALCCFLTYYFHAVLGLGIVFAHFFYVPIIVACVWWKRRGLLVAVFMAALLLFGRIFFGGQIPIINDYARVAMFMVIGLVVAALSAHLQRELAERKRAQEQLHRANRALQTLSECNQAVIRATRESDLLHEICRIVVEVGGYRLAWVGYAEQDEEKTVRPVAQAGYEEGYLRTLAITWADTQRGRGPTGTAIRTGKPFVMRSILTDPTYHPWRAEATKRGYGSSIALPLIAGGETLGVLNIYAADTDAFDGDEVKLLTELADELACGVMALRATAERKKAEAKIQESLREKEVLLKEINHRVKNNIQVISSLLSLQSRQSRDEHTVQMFKDSQGRVKSIALVHEKLYQSQDLTNIDFSDYITSLTDDLFDAYTVNRNILKLEVNAENAVLDVNTAIPCGLIINELVSNCIKHAFPNGRRGDIRIALHSHNNEFTLIVSDNGIGFPDRDFRNTQTLGLQLVTTLVQQLRGTIELDRNGGTTFRVEFQKAAYGEGS